MEDEQQLVYAIYRIVYFQRVTLNDLHRQTTGRALVD